MRRGGDGGARHAPPGPEVRLPRRGGADMEAITGGAAELVRGEEQSGSRATQISISSRFGLAKRALTPWDPPLAYSPRSL